MMKRDTRNCILGGVCSGIANEIGIDPVFVRLLFVIVWFLSAFWPGIFIYLLLWIIMPD
jgi:phage shock protein C